MSRQLEDEPQRAPLAQWDERHSRELESIVRESFMNIEILEDDIHRVKRRLLEHLEKAGVTDFDFS